MENKILGRCKSVISHGQGVHEEVIAFNSRLNIFPCREFEIVPSDIIWASTERFRDILKQCFDVQGETGAWEDVPKIMEREKLKFNRLNSRFKRLESRFKIVDDALTNTLDNVQRLESEVEILKQTLQEEILNNGSRT